MHKKGLFGSKYVWFRPGFYLTGWWTDEPEYAGVDCRPPQIAEVLTYQIAFTGNQPVDTVDLVDFAGLVSVNPLRNPTPPSSRLKTFANVSLEVNQARHLILTLNLT